MGVEPKVGSFREELSLLARGELSRKRRRLGKLTPEQESAVETVLISTADKISDLLIRQVQRSSEAAEMAPGEIYLSETECRGPLASAQAVGRQSFTPERFREQAGVAHVTESS
jgi:hypothetical protein